ncbi:MAG: adenosylcobinamide-GDP ribazoletransferase [Muribaculum sp.]|nr:adenosylcobinamide-GDP ribazoletransferase [Muribaculum sp.]
MSRNPIHEIAAATMLFTRLPLGRVCPMLPVERFVHVVTWWPAVGWIISAFTAATIWFCGSLLGIAVAAVLALICRVLLTGALHEDGLADVADALGGRVSREQALTIMKDSHIGTFGVLALIVYSMLFVALVASVSMIDALWMVVCSATWARFCAGRIIVFLPYARPEGAKNRLSYARPTVVDVVVAFLFGAVPVAACVCCTHSFAPLWGALGAAVAVAMLIIWFRRRIGGYTGDCCGAACLVCEIVFMLVFCVFTR